MIIWIGLIGFFIILGLTVFACICAANYEDFDEIEERDIYD